MESADTYKTLRSPTRAETMVLGSRFIADAVPLTDSELVASLLDRIRKEFHAAAHHCWALRMGTDSPASRFNDDGEPSGTAGKPILTTIERHDLTNVLVVVTRYFGGTKLGTGGLARAYADTADQALRQSKFETKIILEHVEIEVPYEFLPRVKALIYKDGSVLNEEFGEIPRLTIAVRRSAAEHLRSSLVNASRGNVRFTKK